jgi:hypothetical protein
MRESLGVEALTDAITAEPPNWLAKRRLDVRRRERSQRIGHYIDVSRCSHGHLPRSTNVIPRKARSRIIGSVARTCSPPTVAPGDNGRKRKSRRALGGDTAGQNSVDAQWNLGRPPKDRSFPSQLRRTFRLLPRSGSRVRIPSPAPIFFKQISESERSFGVVFCFPASDATAGEAGGSRLRRTAAGSWSSSACAASSGHDPSARHAATEAAGLGRKRRLWTRQCAAGAGHPVRSSP